MRYVPCVLLLFVTISLLVACSPSEEFAPNCSGLDDGHQTFVDRELGIGFCYPAGWTTEEEAFGGSEIVVSDDLEDPGVLIVVFAHELVTNGILSRPEPPLSAEKALGQVAFLVMNSAVIDDADEELTEADRDGLKSATIQATGRVDWGAGEQPVSIIMSGYEQDQAVGAAFALVFDAEAYLDTAETVLDSIVVAVPRLAESGDADHLPLNEFHDGAYQGENQPGRHTYTAEADRPVLILLQNRSPLEHATDLTITVDVHDPLGLLDEQLDYWFISFTDSPTTTAAGFFAPKRDGDYSLTVNKQNNRLSEGSYRIAVFDLGPDAASVLQHSQGELAAGVPDMAEIPDTDGQPLMVYLRPEGRQAADCALFLELRDGDGNKLAETETYTRGDPAFIYWLPSVAGPYSVQVADQFDRSCGYELFVLVDLSTDVAEFGADSSPSALYTYTLPDPDRYDFIFYPSNIAFSNDGKRLLIGAWLYDYGVAEAAYQGDETLQFLNAAAISPAGDTFAVSAGRDGYIWSSTGAASALVAHEEELLFSAMAYSSDGTTLLGGDTDGRILAVDLDSGQRRVINEERVGEDNAFDILAFAAAPQGPLVACGRFDGDIQLVDTTTGVMTELVETKGYSSVDALAFSPDATVLAAAVGREVTLFDVANGDILTTYQAMDTVSGLAFSANGRFLVASTYNSALSIWSSDDTAAALILPHPWESSATAQAVTFGPEENQVTAAFNNGTTATWTLPE